MPWLKFSTVETKDLYVRTEDIKALQDSTDSTASKIHPLTILLVAGVAIEVSGDLQKHLSRIVTSESKESSRFDIRELRLPVPTVDPRVTK